MRPRSSFPACRRVSTPTSTSSWRRRDEQTAADDPAPRVDPITVEVIGAALSSIVEEMGEALVRASYSTNIKERRDCSTALFDTQGNTLCQAEHIPMHLGSFIGIIPHVLKRHRPADMRPGDVFIGNDAYEGGGTHLPDIVLAEPIFVEGRIVAWAVNMAHHSDFADRGHAHIFQEGLRIPPIRLYREGELQKDVQELILLNCQVPRERLSDLRAQMAANRLGVQRMPGAVRQDTADDGAGRGRRPAGLCRAQDARRHRRHPRRHLAFRGCASTTPRSTASCRLRRRSPLPATRCPRFRSAAAGARRHQHDLHGAARDGLLRREDGRGPDHAAQCRPRPAAHRHRARGHVLNCVHPAAVNGRLRPASASST